MTVVKLDTRQIKDWDSFHDVFARVFGFPEFYGRNMNAWIDCMSYLDDPSTGMSAVHAVPGNVVALEVVDVNDFAQDVPSNTRPSWNAQRL